MGQHRSGSSVVWASYLRSQVQFLSGLFSCHFSVAFLSEIATETPFCRLFQELKRTSVEMKYIVKHLPHRWIKDPPWLAEDSQWVLASPFKSTK